MGFTVDNLDCCKHDEDQRERKQIHQDLNLKTQCQQQARENRDCFLKERNSNHRFRTLLAKRPMMKDAIVTRVKEDLFGKFQTNELEHGDPHRLNNRIYKDFCPRNANLADCHPLAQLLLHQMQRNKVDSFSCRIDAWK